MLSVLKNELGGLPTLVGVRPLIMLTGFLGAGKTTLLRLILKELSQLDYRADVILNDRENAQIDRETLREHAESVIGLTGSCVCCEGLDELCTMVLKASQSKHSVLLIELNGTADPIPLLESFTLLESKFLLHPRWQLCVIDSRHFGKRSAYHELEKLQLETASHFFISHSSDLSADAESELLEKIKEINPRASRADAVSMVELLSQAIEKNQGSAVARSGLSSGADRPFDFLKDERSKPHLHDRHHYAHEFTGCNIIFPQAVEEERVLQWLKQLPVSVIRAKALLTLSSDPDSRYLYERVGQEVSPYPIPVRHIDKVPCSGLFIGSDLKPIEILELTRDLLHPDCHFAAS